MANTQIETAQGMFLQAQTAKDLMSAGLVSLPKGTMVDDAVVILTERSFDAAPVIDENGRPIGVVTVSDILVHYREKVAASRPSTAEAPSVGNPSSVEQIMTPTMFTVSPSTPATRVVRKMLDLNVHHLFVVEDDGVPVGVISTGDVLRNLR